MTNKKNLWVYQYSVNNKYKKIRSKSLEKLEEKVKDKNLVWVKFE